MDGGNGVATIGLTDTETYTVKAMPARTASDPGVNPLTGAELGIGLDAPLDRF